MAELATYFIHRTGSYLMHYGVSGQKHGLRRYQNEDGSLTPEGREHYGIGQDIRSIYNSSKSIIRKTQKSIRKTKHAFQNPKEAFNSVISKKATVKPLTRKQKEERKKKVKKILFAAGAVTLAAVGAYGLYRLSKLNRGLIDHAKRSVFEGQKAFGSNKGVAASEYGKLNSVRNAKKQLGLRGAKSVIRYARNNRL